MKVLRHEKPNEEYEVEIQKKIGRGAGICFATFRNGKGAYVSELVGLLFLSNRIERWTAARLVFRVLISDAFADARRQRQ